MADPVSPDAPVLAILGPTGAGKTGLAVRVAEAIPAPVEVVSCDAFQIYRDLDIGTGKPDSDELAAVPHHLIGALAPDDPSTAGRFAGLAASAIRDIRARGGVPLVVGGSGLYFRALREGVFDGPEVDPDLRARLQRLDARPRGRVRLDRLLARLDPESHQRVHPNDRVRRLRALEVALAAGEPISRLRMRRASPLGSAAWTVLALDPPRELLGARIADRVRAMLAAGWIEEARALRKRYREDWPGRLAIGYREILGALAASEDGAFPEDLVRERERSIVAATRRYARRQLTWFRAEPGLTWIRLPGDDPGAFTAAVERFREALEAGAVPEAPGSGAPADRMARTAP